MGPHAHPEVSIHTHCLADYMRHIRADDWKGVAELMLSSADKLSKMGADFLISPDNTIHRAYEFVAERSPLPWLHIVEEVANQAHKSGYHRLGVLGTRYTMEGPVYPQKLAAAGIDHRMPGPKERERIDQIIMNELVCGTFTPRSLAYFTEVIRELKRWLRCRGSGLHRNSAARDSGIVAVAYARLDAAFSASSAAQGGGNY